MGWATVTFAEGLLGSCSGWRLSGSPGMMEREAKAVGQVAPKHARVWFQRWAVCTCAG